jgi:uncharacterized membrane protein YdjX (TVP38/TMEM64 family)
MKYWIRGELGMAKEMMELAESQWGIGILIAGGLLYILLLSLPFVPGVELGILLMCVFGKAGIIFVYLSTIAGLNLAFVMGRFVPQKWIESRFEKLGFSRSIASQRNKIDQMLDRTIFGQKIYRHWLRPFLLKNHYLMLAILFNVPGNSILGGGGGISLAYGHSPNVSWKRFLLTVVLATAPVPILAFFGFIQVETFLQI